MGAPIDVDIDLNLTVEDQDSLGLPRLYPGDTVRWRFQVLDEDGEPVNLTDYHAVFTARRKKTDSTPLLLRRDADTIIGSSPLEKEIGFDADQTEADEEEFTGRGWLEVRFLPISTEEAELIAAAGRSFYDLVIEAPDGTTTTIAEGALEIPRRIGRLLDVP